MSEECQATPPMGLPAREAALDLVRAALDHRGGLEEALERPPFSTLDSRDRGFARMVAMTLLRRLGPIDQRLHGKLRKPPPEPVLMLLRLGAVQALYLDVPAFAAVDTTLRLAESAKATQAFKGLINAVLRGLLREPVGSAEDAEDLVPSWLYARWRAAYGEGDARTIAAMVIDEPPTDLTPRSSGEGDALSVLLEAERLPGGSLRLRRRGDLATWPGFADGLWWVQDAAAAIPARLLNVRAGEKALDLCAAPGGKALQLAAAGAAVTAIDRSGARLQRLQQTLARTGLEAEVVATDATAWRDRREFDAVLLDAPCSATGTFRRHPDVLWASKPGDIARMATIQAELLDAAARRVLSGGRLVYSVCSLEPEEGEQQIEAFLRRHPDFRLAPIQPGEAGVPAASIASAGWARILPHHLDGGLDGFFAARLIKAV